MYGLIGSLKAAPGRRDALVSLLLSGVSGMPGCRSYVVAEDPGEPDTVWITEVWTDAESHKASLELPVVQQAIAKAKPLIASFGEYHTTEPVGGFGL